MKKDYNTLLGALKHYGESSPQKIAVIEGLTGKSITYGELWKRIAVYASFLKDQGLSDGERVTLLVMQTIDYLAAYYGVMLAGGIAIPVEPTATPEKLLEVADYFNSTFIASGKKIQTERNILPFIADKTVTHEFQLPDDDTKLSVILYTTGTTGKSKGVLSSYRCRFCGAENLSEYYDMTSDDIALIPQVLSHSGGLRRVEAMFVSGGTVVVMGAAMFFGDVFKALKRYNCTVFQLVPAQVAQILNSAEKLLAAANDQLRVLAVGSAVIPETHKERLREILPDVRLFNDFGSTEAIGSAYFEWSAYPPKADCVGTEAIHSKIIFLDNNGKVMEHTSRENPGVIATEGDTLMSGYWNEPELSAEIIIDNRVVSADIGYRGKDGMIYICGRKTDIIVSGANKISPFEVEDVLLRIEGLKECAVIGKHDEVMGQLPAVFYVSENDSDIPYETIFAELNKSLEKYKIPRAENIFRLKQLPKTAGTGKIIRKQLEEMLCKQ